MNSQKLKNIKIGDVISIVTVDGKMRTGLLVNIVNPVHPYFLMYFQLLVNDTLEKINTNLIFDCKKL